MKHKYWVLWWHKIYIKREKFFKIFFSTEILTFYWGEKMIIINSAQSMLTILIMLAIGYLLTFKGLFDDNISSLFSNIVVNISLPSLVFFNIITTFDKNELIHFCYGVLGAFTVIFITYIFSYSISKLLNINNNEIGMFVALSAFTNVAFIGLPVNMALFGDKAIPYVLLYYIANITLFWTLGVYGLLHDSCKESKYKPFNEKIIKKFFSPPLISFIIGLLFIFLKIPVPEFISDTTKYIGNLTTPISMFFIGINIYSVKLCELKIDRKMVLLIMQRFILAPIIAVITLYFFPIDLLMKKVFIIQSSLPAMTQIAIVSKAYNRNYKFASIIITLTTVLSIFFIPLYMLIMAKLW